MLVRVAPDAHPAPTDADPTDWVEATTATGRRVMGERLRPTDDATCVRVRDGQVLVTHGPFVEVTEQIAGFDLLEVDDRAEAVSVAAAHPTARFGALELRELLTSDDPVVLAELAALGPAEPPLPGAPVDATFTLLMAAEPGAPEAEPDEADRLMDWIRRWGERDADRGGAPLRPPAEAATVRVRDGQVLVTHGPFAELAEYVAGYNLLNVPDLDAAIQAAAEHPGARLGVIEIRPLWPF